MVPNRAQPTLRIARWTLLLATAVLTCSCRTPSAPTPVASPAPAAGSSVTTSQGAIGPRSAAAQWPIDPDQTVVTVIVRRAGPLARLGHDHVITSAAESGTVWMGRTPADSSVELTLPVERFDVDLPAARAAAGPEFAAPVPDDARAGTRHNMLRAEVLDAADFPTITLRATATGADWAQPILRLAITLHGVTREQDIPVVIERSANRLIARGDLRVNQSDYGITPFSVAGGAIQVADTLEIRFEITATAPPGG